MRVFIPSGNRWSRTQCQEGNQMSRRDELEELAYQLWEQEGKPEGQEQIYYLEAQSMLEESEGNHKGRGDHSWDGDDTRGSLIRSGDRRKARGRHSQD